MAHIINPTAVARAYRARLRDEVAVLPEPLTLVGVLATDEKPSHTYSAYVARACADVGVRYDERHVAPAAASATIADAASDGAVHGILVYYPIFGDERDGLIRDEVPAHKDVEGMSRHWLDLLYRDIRFVDPERRRKAVLPCTPLAIIKLLRGAGPFAGERPFASKTVTIFNRSEVVGRPLAAMLSNDGALVWSFDEHGAVRFRDGEQEAVSTSRAAALASSDVVITGVPSRAFPLVSPGEVRAGITAVNFSTLRNFHPDMAEHAEVFVPRVGPMTVTMVLRNTLRLYRHRA